MAFCGRAEDDPTLNAGLVALSFSGIRTSITKNPYMLVIFQGGGGGGSVPPVPTLDPPMHMIVACGTVLYAILINIL